MRNKRHIVTVSEGARGALSKILFRQEIPRGVFVRENPRTITHYHSYGGLSKFFEGLTRGMLFGAICDNCNGAGIWLPPRVDCPDCWDSMRWVEIDYSDATVYTHSITNLPGAGFKATTPCPLISVAIPGVCTKLMSYMSRFGEHEPYIGMPIRPRFRRRNPTYTILDLSWVPATRG